MNARWLVTLAMASFLSGGSLRAADPAPDNFAHLRELVQRKLTVPATCGLIVTGEGEGGRYFEISRPGSAFRVTVTERPYLTPEEWRKRFDRSADRLPNDKAEPGQAAEALTTSLNELLTMPEFHYRDIGVSVETVTPDGESEPPAARVKHAAEAPQWYELVASLLEAYPIPSGAAH